MSAQDNLGTVRSIYEAFGRGDVPAILDLLTDDVDWATDAAGDEAPWWGPKRGKDQVVTFFTGIGEATTVKEFTPLSFTANDDDEVMVLIRFGLASTATGKEATIHLHHYFRLRDGKVEYYRGSEDTALTAATLQS